MSRPKYSEEQIRTKIAQVPYWFHRIELAPDIVTPGEDDSPAKLPAFGLPEDLRGQRVLDIGAYDGFFTFECERRGGEVVAIDEMRADESGFAVAREILGSNALHRRMSVYELDPDEMGTFDLVLFLGVLYHLRHPMLALERVRSVCRGRMILESQICNGYFIDGTGTPRSLHDLAPELEDAAIAQFYPGAELNNDASNWWSPTRAALRGMLQASGFQILQEADDGVRARVHCTVDHDPPGNR